jgi:hypothetical protein
MGKFEKIVYTAAALLCCVNAQGSATQLNSPSPADAIRPFHIAERYGWINRAIPDAQFETWVDTLARRIASFDRQALAAAKQQVNRHTVPDPKDQQDSQKLFFSSLGWRGYQDRAAQLRSNGIGKPGDFELRFGEHLGTLLSDSHSRAGS